MSKGKREEITRQRKIKMRRITTVRGKSWRKRRRWWDLYGANLWSTKRNFPSMAWRDMNCRVRMLGSRRCGVAVRVEDSGAVIWGCTRPTATRHDKLHASPSPSPSDSSNPILAGAHDFRYPVHWITQYFLSETWHKQYTSKKQMCCCWKWYLYFKVWSTNALQISSSNEEHA